MNKTENAFDVIIHYSPNFFFFFCPCFGLKRNNNRAEENEKENEIVFIVQK